MTLGGGQKNLPRGHALLVPYSRSPRPPSINYSNGVTQRRRAASVACHGLQLHARSAIVPKTGCRDIGPRLTLK